MNEYETNKLEDARRQTDPCKKLLCCAILNVILKWAKGGGLESCDIVVGDCE